MRVLIFCSGLLIVTNALSGCLPRPADVSVTEASQNSIAKTATLTAMRNTVVVGMKNSACTVPLGTVLVASGGVPQIAPFNSADDRTLRNIKADQSNATELAKMKGLGSDDALCAIGTSFYIFNTDWSDSTPTAATPPDTAGANTADSSGATTPDPQNTTLLPKQVLVKIVPGVTKIKKGDSTDPSTETESCVIHSNKSFVLLIADASRAVLDKKYVKVRFSQAALKDVFDTSNTDAGNAICASGIGFIYLPHFQCIKSGGGFNAGTAGKSLQMNPAIDAKFHDSTCAGGDK